MAQNIFKFGETEEMVLGIVKAQYGLKNKNQAIQFILKVYADSFLEYQLRPEFLEKLNKIKDQRGIPFKNIEELRKLTGE